MRDRWTEAAIPDQTGRVAVITGGNAGLGRQVARVLAARGARVVLACRNAAKAEAAAAQIQAGYRRAQYHRPEHGRMRAGPAEVTVVRLDLASLASVRLAAAEILAACPRLDLLINNAGVMEVPYQRTADGFELTLATNHLGHYALTGLLLGRLLATPGSRVVTMSSQAHHAGAINFADLQSAEGYDPATAYAQSKLANMLFSYELDRRLRAGGAPVSALAAHPGVVATDLFVTRSGLNRTLISPQLRLINFWAVQNARMGAL